jgi:hypothetical protein
VIGQLFSEFGEKSRFGFDGPVWFERAYDALAASGQKSNADNVFLQNYRRSMRGYALGEAVGGGMVDLMGGVFSGQFEQPEAAGKKEGKPKYNVFLPTERKLEKVVAGLVEVVRAFTTSQRISYDSLSSAPTAREKATGSPAGTAPLPTGSAATPTVGKGGGAMISLSKAAAAGLGLPAVPPVPRFLLDTGANAAPAVPAEISQGGEAPHASSGSRAVVPEGDWAGTAPVVENVRPGGAFNGLMVAMKIYRDLFENVSFQKPTEG